MFTHDMIESRQGQVGNIGKHFWSPKGALNNSVKVDIPDVSAVTLQSLLDWVYGSPLTKTRLTPHLLAAADKYKF